VKVLLDIHALLWWLADDDQIGIQARDLIEDPGNNVLISVASLWKIVVMVRVGKLRSTHTLRMFR
jgi:PIN domain nuclease of toxin-antitoxin system